MGNNNSLNSITSYFYPKTSSTNMNKLVKNVFMSKINRKPNTNQFVNLSKYVTQHLFKFFDYNELYELGKTNVFFMNNVIEYLENNPTWPEEVRKLITKYNFQIYQNEVDLTENLAKKNNRRYKYPKEENKGVNYYQFNLDGNRYISIANSFKWAHFDNNNYWTKEKAVGSYEENGDVFYLINVCWLNTHFHFYHVNPKNNYKLYVNEFFVIHKNFKNKLKIKVILDENKIVYESIFPSDKIHQKNSGQKNNCKLKEDYICYIAKEDFNDVQKDQNGDCLVKVEFSHRDLNWKSGWFIDGGCLVETTQEEIDKLKEKEEEKEKEKEEEKNEEKKINLRRFGIYRDDDDDDEDD